jgi:phosphatidylserine decarboxylase
MSDEAIRFRNRYTGAIETEAIYGERWLRWAYGTGAGRLSLALVSRPWFSRWYGWRMDRPRSRRLVAPFIREFKVDTTEFADPPDSYRTFNEFFHRRLRPGARPVDPDPRAIVFPADGRHLGFANLAAAQGFFVKGQRFELAAFLGDSALAERYRGGPAVLSRLSPVDYHRFHFPVAGVPSAARRLDGGLWSVNPVALRQRLEYLWRNRRWQSTITTETVGTVVMTEIGATNVGSLEHTYRAGEPVEKGQEKGYFRFGGSAVLTLFEPGRVALADDLLGASAEGLELYARFGDVMARAVSVGAS